MTAAALVVLLLSLGACAYVYAGYPAVLWVVSRFRERPVAKADVRPPVTVIVPARDEEGTIGRKVENTLALRYPPDLLEVLVVSDGSTDDTASIVRSYDDPRVRLVALPAVGKIPALNEAARRARGDVLVFTDADVLVAPRSLEALIRNFADPEVGGACGRRRHRRAGDEDTTDAGESLYWRFDLWQKSLESRIGSVFGADGALYAIRRELYTPLGDPAQADDLAISMRVPLQGRRFVFEPGATSHVEAPADAGGEFRRKVRIAYHSIRALLLLGPELWRSGFYSFELISHKLLRYAVPLFLPPLYLSNVVVAGTSPVFRALLAGQTIVYLLAMAGYALRRHPLGRAGPLFIPFFFCFVNAAALLGIVSVLRGVRRSEWRPRKGMEVS